MSKKVLISIILALLIIFVINVSTIYAADTVDDGISGGKSFVSDGRRGDVNVNKSELQETSNTVYNILLVASFIVVAIVGITLGIKYMMSGVDEKADVKKSLTIFVIGTLVAYGAFGIWKVVVDFLNSSGL